MGVSPGYQALFGEVWHITAMCLQWFHLPCLRAVFWKQPTT